jgi:cystathionine gamma-synthase
MNRPGTTAASPDRALWTAPRWKPEDLGQPLPKSDHANSVCLPCWQDVVDYEEKKPRVIERLQAGYPRFVVPAACAKLFEQARAEIARPGERCHLYPTRRSAERCAAQIRAWSGHAARIAPWPAEPVHAVCYPEAAQEQALKHWRHTGDGISSRRAEAILAGRTGDADSAAARAALRNRIADLAGVPPDSVYLFKSGMAAIYAVYRAVSRLRPGSRCAQFGFPYVDTLRILKDFGTDGAFFPVGDENEFAQLRALAATVDLAGVFCEFPSNPMLSSPDLAALSKLARSRGFPLVVDDTIATWANVDLRAVADITVTSLTKFFTGRGDVMAGSAIVQPASPLAGPLRDALDAEYEDCIWGENAVLAEAHSRDFAERVRRTNATTAEVVAWLQSRPEVADVFYPSVHDRAKFDAFRKSDGGYGGLFSVLLNDAARTAPAFYDKLPICKGPNLGTTFTLCCPFTLLAHYHELDWAEQCGVPRNLLRFSIGQEPAPELITRLARAF